MKRYKVIPYLSWGGGGLLINPYCFDSSYYAPMRCYLQFWQETDKAAYLLRQYFFNNLHDRLSTRPFLNLIEKKWLAFQVIFSFINIFPLN